MPREVSIFARLLLVGTILAGTTFLAVASAAPSLAMPADQRSRDLSTPAGLYQAACGSCHGVDGRGVELDQVGFDVPLPDFTDCSFATREPDADWFVVVHQGGPVRGFANNMPAYYEALTDEQIAEVVGYLRVFCDDLAWPRGELNFPRPLVTEKAYPEDELVWTTEVDAEGNGAVINELLYERRFGARNQWEVKVPFGAAEGGPDGDWTAGIGDVALGVKRVLAHGLEAGAIFSVGGEVIFPTGDADDGFGKDTVIFEPFASAGFALPRDSFVHLQAGIELSADTEKADNEAFWRAVIGSTLTQGRFGRSWSPMLEILGTTELGNGTESRLDLLPQVQISLNTRQHVLANVGIRVPVTDSSFRDTRVLVYLLWEWFDGGLFDGW